MSTKIQIEKKIKRKTDSYLVQTIVAAKKNKGWLKVAEIISKPRRKRENVNLEEINQKVKDGEKVIVPGKVLSGGNIEKKIKLIALGFSKNAREKILKSGSEILTIVEEIKKNPEAKGIRILTK